MIRYAAHRVYVQADAALLVRSMVELDDGGAVVSVSPFAMEVHHTVWVDGVIVVSDVRPESPRAGESFDEYIGRTFVKKGVRTADRKEMRAYQVGGLDIPAMRFRQALAVTQLK